MNLEIINNERDFQNIHDEWNSLLCFSQENCVFLTHEWFFSWWKHLSDGNNLSLLVSTDDCGKVQGIAPFMQREKTLYFMASQEVSDYCDFIYPSEAGVSYFSELMDFIAHQFPEIQYIDLINIKESSNTLFLLPALAKNYGFSCKSDLSDVTLVLSLSSSYKDYLAGMNRKLRHELRRKLRRIQSLSEMKFEKITNPEQTKEFIDSFINLHKGGSLEKERFWEKNGMMEFFKEIAYGFSFNHWLELYFLYSGVDLLASLLVFVHKDRKYFYNVAFSPHYAYYSPGFFLFDRAIRNSIAEKRASVDFLRGEERYKYFFGARTSKIYNLSLSRVEEHV